MTESANARVAEHFGQLSAEAGFREEGEEASEDSVVMIESIVSDSPLACSAVERWLDHARSGVVDRLAFLEEREEQTSFTIERSMDMVSSMQARSVEMVRLGVRQGLAKMRNV